jgi:tyrosinase
VNNLSPNDPILTFFGKAIERMQAKPLNDPLSWRYQAAIHDYPVRDGTLADRQRQDPLAQASDVLPSDRGTYWRQCQHGSWFFLPWHRMYLHYFEKIVMSLVANMPGGPKDWALPYWNYSASATAALLPAAFRSPTQPDGSRNFLNIAQRIPQANSGLPFLGPTETSVNCLKGLKFGNAFGGPPIKNHPPGSAGLVEQTPHNPVHGTLGASGGWMGGFTSAPLDPMFWLHHCNIDRLWEVWVQRQKHLGRTDRNPKVSSWLNEPFAFHDATGTAVTITSREVMNTRIAPLSYEYEDTSDPFNGAP